MLLEKADEEFYIKDPVMATPFARRMLRYVVSGKREPPTVRKGCDVSASGIYRSFSLSLFDSAQYRKLTPAARSILLHLRVNVGPWGMIVWYADEARARLANQSGYEPQAVDAAQAELESDGWIEREDNVVWVKDHLAEDPHLSSANPKHRKALHRHLAGLPQLQIVSDFASDNGDWIPIQEARAMDIEWVLNGNLEAIGSRSSSRSSNQEQEIEEEDAAAATSTAVVVRELLLETDRAPFDNLLAHVPEPHLWAEEVRTALDAGTAPALVGKGIRDFQANGKLASPNLRSFRRYFSGAVDEAKSRLALVAGLTAAEDATVDQIVDACSRSGIFTAMHGKDFAERCGALAETGEFSADEVAAIGRINLAFCFNASRRNDRASLKRHIASLVFGPAPEEPRERPLGGTRRTAAVAS